MIRTRFAPSPTGYLHIGGVRTALFNWLFARKHGGAFILRIDDTDQERNVEAALQPILSGFRWLGIDWDEGPEVGGPHAPYYQSQRSELYQKAVEELLDKGLAYRDYSTPEERQEEREEGQKAGASAVYSRRWMAEGDRQAAAFEAEGREAAVRLKMPRQGECKIHDLVRGDVAVEWAQEQDHYIQRANGGFIYHLATVVDDNDYQVSHVIRSEEHLSNTPRQIFIAESLGYDPPKFAHLPYVAEPGSKTKLSKRKISKYLKNREFKQFYDEGVAIAERINLPISADTFNPVLVDFYEAIGFLPDAIINYLVLLGWSLDGETELFTREEMIEHFSLERVNKAPASFDPQKLQAFQARHMTELPAKQKVPKLIPFLQQANWVSDPVPCELGPQLNRIVEYAESRISVAGDILNYDEFFKSAAEIEFDPKAFKKRVMREGAVGLLQKFRDQLATAADADVETLKTLIEAFVEAEQIKLGEINNAVRVAITGKGVGLGVYETLSLLGIEESLQRIDRAIEFAGQL